MRCDAWGGGGGDKKEGARQNGNTGHVTYGRGEIRVEKFDELCLLITSRSLGVAPLDAPPVASRRLHAQWVSVGYRGVA